MEAKLSINKAIAGRYGRWLHLSLLLVVLLLAAWLRLWRLPELPPGFYYDEAYNAMDGISMRETGSFYVYFVGDTGRHALMPYLIALSTSILGMTPYACRFISALLGILLVALVYRWLITLFATERDRHWLALLAAAGLAGSFWHMVMSRTAYEATLVPLFVVLISYFFWRGWQDYVSSATCQVAGIRWQRSGVISFALAGFFLGLSQYAYPSARLLPLIFGLFMLIWTVAFVLDRRSKSSLERNKFRTPDFETGRNKFHPSDSKTEWAQLVRLWLGLLVMAAAALIVFLPLGLFILQDPATFFFRSGDVFILTRVARGEASLTGQLWEAVRVFIDGYSPTWRHNIVGESGFDWLNFAGFWLGLIVAIRRCRQPAYLFLLLSLGVTWLPALLSAGTSTLRLSGLLPIYYAFMGLGLLTVIHWSARYLGRTIKVNRHRGGARPAGGIFSEQSKQLSNPPRRYQSDWLLKLAMVALLLVMSGGCTAYNYFGRWANETAVYDEYDSQWVDLARRLIDESQRSDILLPFTVYMHPTMRFMLYDQFHEVETPPPVRSDRPAVLVKTEDTLASALVWLTRDERGRGLAYVAHPQRPAELAALVSIRETTPVFHPRTGETMASLILLENLKPLLPHLTDWHTVYPVDYTWGDQIRLVGYEVWPKWVRPGQSLTLNLYWRSLIEQPQPYTRFIQLVNGRGEPVAQWTDSALTDEHRWRIGGMIPDQNLLWTSPDLAPGPYLVRMGLFNAATGQRVPIYTPRGEVFGDQLLLGLFYVAEEETTPDQPQIPVGARLGDQIELLGYSQPPVTPGESFLKVKLYWRAKGSIEADYTVFVQLLDQQGQRVTGWDSQPLTGQYPTSRWQVNEVIIDEFNLPLPPELPPGTYQLVTGMYDLASGQRLPSFAGNGEPLPDGLVPLTQRTIP